MIGKTCRANLFAIAAAYADATGVSMAQVSKRFYGRSNFLDAFRRGEATCHIDKFDEMVAALRRAWPPDARWPFLRAALIPAPARVPRRKQSPAKSASAPAGVE